MKKQIILFFTVCGLLLLPILPGTVRASNATQGFVTPTPQEDGRIIIVVQEGWNCSTIQNFTGIPVSQLKSLNRLDENCTLQVGQEILIGIVDTGEAATATPDPSLATAIPLPTPTPEIGSGKICVLLYNDLNGDALKQDTETVIENGAISVTGTSGQYSKTATTTTAADPVCFEAVLSGTYNISVAAPEGYNPTTQQNFTLDVKVGEQIYVDFGAQIRAETSLTDNQPEGGSWNIYGLLGGGLVGAALLLAGYAFFNYRNK